MRLILDVVFSLVYTEKVLYDLVLMFLKEERAYNLLNAMPY
jgi:hypothetical protein